VEGSSGTPLGEIVRLSGTRIARAIRETAKGPADAATAAFDVTGFTPVTSLKDADRSIAFFPSPLVGPLQNWLEVDSLRLRPEGRDGGKIDGPVQFC
jgi:hypothetical protein